MSQDMIINALNWRYATKKFDPSRKISNTDMQTLIEAVRLAPTSFGLQPFRLINVTDPRLRAELVAASWGQQQVKDASHLFVFATLTTLDEAYVDRFIDLTCRTRHMDAEKLHGYVNMMKGFLQELSPEELHNWAGKQAYIAAGFLMETAALLKIDACPMGGFDPKQYDAILELGKLGLSAALAMPVGYRSSEDPLAQAAKVRIPAEEMVVKI